MKRRTGAGQLCSTLEQLGVEHVFGVPGTQNVGVFEELRKSPVIRTVLPTHETAAGFMANGYYRASGRPGVFTTIPGPGFALALAPLAEAAHDSAAVLYIVEKPKKSAGRQFSLQAIDQHAMAAPVVKRIVDVDDAADMANGVEQAYRATLEGEPGPVMLHVDARAFEGAVASYEVPKPAGVAEGANPAAFEEAIQRLSGAKRPLLFVGQGTAGAAAELKELAEKLGAPVVATRSGRGALPENHPLSRRFDTTEEGAAALNSLLDSSDLILAAGCKLTHNGSYGFRLRLPKDKLIHVDSSEQVLHANYPASLAVRADAKVFLSALAAGVPKKQGWTGGDLPAAAQPESRAIDPVIAGVQPNSMTAFFDALRRAMPAESCLVTDSGRHQTLATRYFPVLAPRGLAIPSDFQSMGFGLPGAIGAKLAVPGRKVVALIGDGGLLMSGVEIQTAVRERIPLTLIVFVDHALGQIRLQQLSSYGATHATTLAVPDLEAFALSMGAEYRRLEGDSEAVLRGAIEGEGVTLVEVGLGDGAAMRRQGVYGKLRRVARESASPSWIGWIRKIRSSRR